MAHSTEADINLAELFGDRKSSTELIAMIRRLEGMLNADIADLFDGKKLKSPEDWPAAARQAVTRLNVNDKTGAWSFQMIDKSRVAEQLAKLTGLYKNDEEVDNPLETALSQIPREDLKTIAEHLRWLGQVDEEIAAEDAGGAVA